MILELLQNVALLVMLSVCLQILGRRLEQPRPLYKLLSGVLFGLVGVAAMMAPLTFAPGLIYDGRSIILSLAGFIGGPLTATVAIIICMVYRLWLGGIGAIVGVLVIVQAGALGSIFYVLRRRDPRWEQPLWLWLIGMIVQIAMLATQLLLPGRLGMEVLRIIAPSVLLLYPLGFLASALVFLDFQRRRRLEETLASHNRILEMIAAGEPLTATLEQLTREIERQAPGMIASVLLLDEDGVHLRHGAAPQLPPAYNQAVDGLAIGEGAGSCGTAAWRRVQVIVENIATDPLWDTHRALALQYGLQSCWSTPILDTGNSVLGTFALYYRRPAKPTAAQIDLINQATHSAAIAIGRHRQEEALRAERDFARTVIDTMGEGLSVTDAEGRFTYVNAAFATMLDMPIESLIGSMSLDFVASEDRAVLEQALIDRRMGRGTAYDVHLRAANDRLTPVQVTGEPRHSRSGEYLGAIAVLTDLSERKLAEQALRESEERYRLLVDNFPHAIGVHQDGKLVFVNRAAADLFGVETPDALIGMDTATLIASEEVANARERTSRLHAGESGLYPVVTTYVRLDGTRIPVEVVAAPLLFGGRPATQVIVQDITERKRRDREIQAQAQIAQALTETTELQPLLRRILAAAVHAVESADAGGIVLAGEDGSLQVSALTGYQEERLRGFQFPNDTGYAARAYRLCRPLLVDDVQADPALAYSGEIDELRAIKSAIAAPLVVRGEVTGVIGLDSFTRTGAFDADDLDVLSNIAATAALVLERARLFEEMNTQARQMAQIMQAAPQGVLLFKANGQVLMANRVGTRDLSVLAGAKVGDLIDHLGDQPLTELFATPPTGPWYEAHAGNRTFEIIARPISNGAAPEQWVVLIDDVTYSRQVRQQTQLQERLATVGQLAAGIAHDFNNILSVILLQAQLVSKTSNESEQTRERMAVIVTQTQHAKDLVRQILDFSRQSMLQRQPVDLHTLCSEQVGLLERALPETIAVEFVHGGENYTVTGDPASLRQVIMNLAINARDAMPEGGRLRIELAYLHYDTERETPLAGMRSGAWVRLAVSDTGTGIAPDVVPHIFDPFYTTKEPGKGTGLGLAQVHGIVAQHEGYLALETESDAGTAFFIYLPASRAAQVVATSGRQSKFPLGNGETLLLVEDNQALRYALIDMLESLGYGVVEASNGREALARLVEHGATIAAVLSDVVMPQMGGIALAHALRMQGYTQPIILMSGHPLDEETESLQDAGVHTWLSKPCTLEDLAHALGSSLGRSAEGFAASPGA